MNSSIVSLHPSSIVVPVSVANQYEKLRDTVRDYKRAATRQGHIDTVTKCLHDICLPASSVNYDESSVNYDEQLKNLPVKLVGIIQNLRRELHYTALLGATHIQETLYKLMIWNTWTRDFPTCC
jgi:hypothetical protein